MAAQVTLPGVGPVSKRALLIGGSAAALVMGVVWWRRRKAAAPASPAGATATDTTGADMSTADMSGVGSGGVPLGAPDNSTAPPSSNPQWDANVTAALANVVDPTQLAQALGLYLTGQAVTPDQTTIIDEAIGVGGYPPVSGPNGYPPAIRTQAAGGQTPPPAPGPTSPAYQSVQAGWKVNQWIRDLQHGYGDQGGNAGVTYEQLVSWNPGFNDNIQWRSSPANGNNTELNTFKHAATYRIR